MSNEEIENPELEKLGTHVNGALNLQETRHTAAPVQVDRPEIPFPGPYDTRTGLYGDNQERPDSPGIHAPLNPGPPRTPDVTHTGDLDTTQG
jgi:hypothetical protein